jgi:hypothetical protein
MVEEMPDPAMNAPRGMQSFVCVPAAPADDGLQSLSLLSSSARPRAGSSSSSSSSSSPTSTLLSAPRQARSSRSTTKRRAAARAPPASSCSTLSPCELPRFRPSTLPAGSLNVRWSLQGVCDAGPHDGREPHVPRVRARPRVWACEPALGADQPHAARPRVELALHVRLGDHLRFDM